MKTKKEYVYDDIKSLIIKNKISKEEPLGVKELCEQYDVSRTTIREALEELMHEGYVKRKKRVGFFVTRIGYQDMIEIFELREALEVTAVKLFVERIDNNRKEQFERYVLLQEKAYFQDDQEAFMENDMKIHSLIVKGAQNRKLENAIQAIYSQVRLMALGAKDDRKICGMAHTSHKKLLKCVENDDAEQAQQVMREHIMQVKNYHKEKYYNSVKA